MPIDLGTKPEKLRVNLSRGGSFTTTLRADDPWPAGITLGLVFFRELDDDIALALEWSATITGADAVWDLDPEDVAEVINGAYSVVRLHYTEADGSVFVWGTGDVNVL